MSLSNGMSSPLFLSPDVDSSNVQKLRIENPEAIRKIQGTYQLAAIRQMFFKDIRGKTLASIETEEYQLGDEIELQEGEQIVGVYGSHYAKGFINHLGFIVWRP